MMQLLRQQLGLTSADESSDIDMLTKALDRPRHRDKRARVGVQPTHEAKAGLSALLEGVLAR